MSSKSDVELELARLKGLSAPAADAPGELGASAYEPPQEIVSEQPLAEGEST